VALQVVRGKGETFLDETGKFYALLGDVAVRIPRRPFKLAEIAKQTWFIASVSLLPALLLTMSFGLVIGLEVYNITRQFGADSAQGAAMVLAIVREIGPLGTTFMMAAAGGTAITADLGSRKVRDEIAAMQVMSVDPQADLAKVQSMGVGRFGYQYEQVLGGSEFQKALASNQAVATAKVISGPFVASLSKNDAQTFTVLQQTIRGKSSAQPEIRKVRVQSTLVRTPDGWRADWVEIQ
jgi:hypothetical protein